MADNNLSLADQAVETLALVKAMDAGLNMNHPHRHVVRNLKRNAEQLILVALRAANDLAWAAKDVSSLVEEIHATAPPQAQGQQQGEA